MTDDLTSVECPDADATWYIPEPAAELPYFDAANADDPLPRPWWPGPS